MSIKRPTKSITPRTSASRSPSRPEETRCKSIAAVIDNQGMLRWRASRDRRSCGILCEWIFSAQGKNPRAQELLMPSHQTALAQELKQNIRDEDLTKNATQCSINQQIFPLTPERFLSELPEPPLTSLQEVSIRLNWILNNTQH